MSGEVEHELVVPGTAIRLRFSAHSDRGVIRRVNEDSFVASAPIFAVADGMGGHAFGDRASQTTVATLSRLLVGERPIDAKQVLDSIRAANEEVRAVGEQAGEHVLSGTTLTGIALVNVDSSGNYHWMAFNIGDSRIYGWDGRTLSQISVDHSAVQELIDAGVITPSQAHGHRQRNVVTRALGAQPSVDADIWLLPLRSRQTFILCSDGVSKELTDDEIARIIVFHDAEHLRNRDSVPMSLAARLVNAAVAAGGSDNVTVVVVHSEVSSADVFPSDDDTRDRQAPPGKLDDTRPREVIV